jgi:twitching motility two-component system response regulator PilH
MMSRNQQATEQIYVKRIGADDIMKKPFSRFDLFSRIEQMLDENRVPRRNPA